MAKGKVPYTQLASTNNLAMVNDKVAIDDRARLEKDNLSHRVKACLINELKSGNRTTHLVVNKLGMSERSLQRRLKRERTSFRALKDEVRRQLSLSYVRDNKFEIAKIAFLLGYAEQSAFSRAFRRMPASPLRR